MRTLALAVLLAAASPAAAEELPVVTLTVGETRAVGGLAPICDDPRVAVISRDGAGVLTAVGKGETICSIARTGGRQVFRVVVREPPPAGNERPRT